MLYNTESFRSRGGPALPPPVLVTTRATGPAGGPMLRIGVEDRLGRLDQVIEVRGLVEAVHLFERLRDLGLQCRAGRRVGALRLTRVFVPSPANHHPGSSRVCEEA